MGKGACEGGGSEVDITLVQRGGTGERELVLISTLLNNQYIRHWNGGWGEGERAIDKFTRVTNRDTNTCFVRIHS